MRLIRDETAGSTMAQEECKYFPTDLEENRIRGCIGGSVSEQSAVWKEPFVFSEVCVFQYYRKNGKKSQPQSEGIENKTSLEEQRAPE